MSKQRQMLIVFILPAVFIFTLLWAGFVHFQKQRLAVDLYQAKNEVGQLQQEAQLLTVEIAASKQALLQQKAVAFGPSQVYATLKELADRHGLTIVELTMQQAKKETPLLLKLTGDYGNAAGFLASLSESRGFRVLKMDMVQAPAGSDGSIQLTLVLSSQPKRGAE